MDPLLDRVRRAIAAHRLLAAGDRIVAAVSGGADSVALLHLLVSLQPSLRLVLHIAHLDHGLRPESAQDAAFVQGLGERWGVPTTIERREVAAICAREGWSLEDGARRVRYQFLLDAARRARAGRVALAHTADDQAETVLMRLLRGSGLLGLGAIPITRQLDDDIAVVRPLLQVWRRELLGYLEEHGVTYREDATNADGRFVRNRIRRELLPLLERDYNPAIKKALTQLAEQSRCDDAYLQEAAGRQWKRMVKDRRPARIEISMAMFRRQPNALQRQLIRLAVRQLQGDLSRFEFRHWLEVERLFLDRPEGSVVDLPDGLRFRRDGERVVGVKLHPSEESRYTEPP